MIVQILIGALVNIGLLNLLHTLTNKKKESCICDNEKKPILLTN